MNKHRNQAFNLHQAESQARQMQSVREAHENTAPPRKEIEARYNGLVQILQGQFYMVKLNHELLIQFLIESGSIDKDKWTAFAKAEEEKLQAALDKAQQEALAAQTMPDGTPMADGGVIPAENSNGKATFAQAEGAGIVLTD